MLRAPLKNFHLLGAEMRRSRYSSVNQAMQMLSTRAKDSLSASRSFESFVFGLKESIVFKDNAIVDKIMKRIDKTATT